jgi:hypothetical protein
MSGPNDSQGQDGGAAAELSDGSANGTAGGAPGSGFDVAAYLASLPEDERGYWEQMPASVLAKNAQRTMTRQQYDRKRSEEGPQMRTLQEQLAQLQQQNALLAQNLQILQAGGQPGEQQAPLDYESAKRLAFTTNDEDEYSRAFDSAVEARVRGVLDNDPTLRQVRSALAMRQATARAGDGVTEADQHAAEALLRQDLAADGVDIQNLPDRVIQFMFPNYVRLAKTQRLMQEHEGRPTPPRQPGAAAVIPPTAMGTTPPTRAPGATDPFTDPNSTVASRRKATMEALGMTPGDMARLRQEI